MNNWNQRIELEGCLNLRDVGGYPTKDGKVTRQGVLLRSDSLSRLPETSVQALSERGVRAIVDLRGPWETEAEDPHVFSSLAGVKYTNVPLLLQPEGPRPLTSPPNPPDVHHAEAYCSWLDDCRKQIKEIMSAIARYADEGQTPIVVHCAAGKDRTGVVTALLLDLAGVPPQLIAEDYALSDVCLQPLWEKERRRIIQETGDEKLAAALTTCPPGAMLLTLAYLRERYGGAEDYLRGIGLSAGEIDTLRRMLVEP